MSAPTDGLSPADWRDWARDIAPQEALIGMPGVVLRRWASTEPDMRQPPLDHHLLVLHMGGAKRVVRAGGGRVIYAEVCPGAHTMIPAGHSYGWRTHGPIDFAHLFIQPARFTEIVAGALDIAPALIMFGDVLGRDDPLVARLFELLLTHHGEQADPVAAEQQLTMLCVRLATLTGLRPAASPVAPLPLVRVARLRDYVRANLATPIRLADLAHEVNVSPYHLIRAFRAATGLTPHAFVMGERIAAAMVMLRTTDQRISDVARLTGFGAPGRLSERFRAMVGLSPVDYRRRMRAPAPDEAGG